MKEDLEETYLKPQKEHDKESFRGTTLLGFKEMFKTVSNFLSQMKKASEEKHKRDIENQNRRRKETLKSRGQEIHFLKQEKVLLKEEKEIADLKEELGEVDTDRKGHKKRDLITGGLGGPF